MSQILIQEPLMKNEYIVQHGRMLVFAQRLVRSIIKIHQRLDNVIFNIHSDFLSVEGMTKIKIFILIMNFNGILVEKFTRFYICVG